ncbi:MAG: sigma-54 dependent transcriptional regulator [Spirochaetaceae bacterium]|jgi:two-component system response regulator AtoC|nr:sigma-54 dependent transcriptional regulator [Spirochaetaceae bacterium]
MKKKDFKILIVDDELGIREGLKKALSFHEYSVETVETAQQAIESLRIGDFQLAFIDLRLPDKSGLEIIKKINTEKTTIIMITAFATVETAVEAMKFGAIDYLRKPFELNNVIEIADRFFKKISMREKISEPAVPLNEYIMGSPAMVKIRKIIEKIQCSSIPVLLLGESGTGKEMMAKLIHKSGNLKDKPFIGINCAAIPVELLESELFGHEKGSFTGAFHRKIGKFEQAEDGIIFLDEIGDMPFILQSKLLRVLEEKSFERVGGNTAVPVKARIIASTNQNLKEYVEKKKFRSDLYYRLNGVKIVLPPLKERQEDLEPLINYFFSLFNSMYEKDIRISSEAMNFLKSYTWPGNIRELKSVLESSILLADSHSILLSDDFPIEIHNSENKENIDSLEKEQIINALSSNNFNRSLTADALSISRKTLYNKMKKFSIGMPNEE